MKASAYNKIEFVKVLMEARADPFLRDNEVRSISSYLCPFHDCRVKQQEIGQEN